MLGRSKTSNNLKSQSTDTPPVSVLNLISTLRSTLYCVHCTLYILLFYSTGCAGEFESLRFKTIISVQIVSLLLVQL